MANLGDLVKDKLTGLEGIVVAKTSYLTGCDRLSLQPKMNKKDVTPPDWYTIDESRAIVLKAGVHEPITKVAAAALDPV